MTAVRSQMEPWNCVSGLFLHTTGRLIMSNISYTTSKDQVEKLRSQNLIVENEELAIRALNTYGYSNLIKSYRDPYTITIDGKKTYRSGVKFEQILSLYTLDKNLRNAVMAAMLDLEEFLKEQTANVIAQSFGVHQDDYLDFKKYSNKRKRKPQFTLSGILKTMRDTLNTDKDPIHYYKTKYGVVPPWILFKSIYFGTAINFIDQFKAPERNKLVDKMYETTTPVFTDAQLWKLMMDTLYICSEYRNIAAHGGRVYNYHSSSNLRVAEIFGSEDNFQLRGFSRLLGLLSLIKYTGPISELNAVLNQEVNRHCALFPEDVTYLGQILNLDIFRRDVVYISPNSRRYHTNPHCSGLKDAQEIDLEQAIAEGYTPCKKCNN